MPRKLSAYQTIVKQKAGEGISGPELMRLSAQVYRAQPVPPPKPPKVKGKVLRRKVFPVDELKIRHQN